MAQITDGFGTLPHKLSVKRMCYKAEGMSGMGGKGMLGSQSKWRTSRMNLLSQLSNTLQLAGRLGAQAALAKDLELVLCIHMEAHSYLQPQLPGIQCPIPASKSYRYTYRLVDTDIRRSEKK